MSELEQVRGELRRLGYLSHGVERFLLQDALRPRRPLRALATLAVKVGVLAGGGLATAGAIGLTALNGNLTATPFDVLPLFLHLLLPAAAISALLFLALGGLLTLVLRLYPVRRIETLSFSVALVVGLLALLAALVAARRSGFALEIPGWQLALLGAATLVVGSGLIKVVHHGLLSLAIRLTDLAPRQRIFSRRGVGAVILVGLLLLMLPVVMAARAGSPPAPPALPTAPGDRVLLLGIDGVLPSEIDYLLARADGELPALEALRAEGGAWLSYPRASEPPAALWTTVATGLDPAVHGVSALDSFRPLGVATPLSRVGPTRAYWSSFEVPLGLAEYRPLLSHRRRAFAFWELVARGGAPVLTVNWWSTFPAEALPGLVVAHGAYQLLGERAVGAAAPESEIEPLAELAARMDSQMEEVTPDSPLVTLPTETRRELKARALDPDAFYRAAFRQGLVREPRAAALYLPGLDLAAAGWSGGDVAFADLLRAELRQADRLLAEEGHRFGTIAVVFDPGRRQAAAEGRILLWRRGGCEPSADRLPAPADPRALAPALLRAAGLPQSAELPEPPAVCGWPTPPARVATYGLPERRRQGAELGDEYLAGLKALGYL